MLSRGNHCYLLYAEESAIGTTPLSVPSGVLMATVLSLQCMMGKDGVPVGDFQQEPKCNYENLRLP